MKSSVCLHWSFRCKLFHHAALLGGFGFFKTLRRALSRRDVSAGCWYGPSALVLPLAYFSVANELQMTRCRVGEFGRWRLAVQRAIFSLCAANTLAINTVVTRLVLWLGSGAAKLSSYCLHQEQQVRGNCPPGRH